MKIKNEENIVGRQREDWQRGFQRWNNAISQFLLKSYYVIFIYHFHNSF